MATCASTFLGYWWTGYGCWWYEVGRHVENVPWSNFMPESLAYCACVMTILVCHEAGHFLQARRYGVYASLPYFLPMPFTPLGTLGAVIVMDSRVKDRRALFDIGITGPLAGLVPTLIFCVLGMQFGLSRVGVPDLKSFEFGDPLVFKWLTQLTFGPVPDGHDVLVGPMAFAGWVGLLVTAINLFPIGQLDGGHVLYGLLRRRALWVATAVLVGAVIGAAVFHLTMWWLMLLLLVLMGPRHPPTTNDNVPLGAARIVLGWLTLAFLPLGFTPNPFPSLTGPPPHERQQPRPPQQVQPDEGTWVRQDRGQRAVSAQGRVLAQFPSDWSGAGMRPPKCTKASLAPALRTSMTGVAPNSPPKSTRSPALAPGTGIKRTAEVLSLITPMAISSAMMAAIVSGGVSPGTATMSRPTEHTEVMASSFSSTR